MERGACAVATLAHTAARVGIATRGCASSRGTYNHVRRCAVVARSMLPPACTCERRARDMSKGGQCLPGRPRVLIRMVRMRH